MTGSCQIHRNGPEPGNGAGENRGGLHETVAERPKGRLRARKQAEEEIWPGIPREPGQDGPATSGEVPWRGENSEREGQENVTAM